MNKTEIIEHLKREKAYEDGLIATLNYNILEKIYHIPDLSDVERVMVEKNILILLNNSKMHSQMFNDLMKMVIAEDERN